MEYIEVDGEYFVIDDSLLDPNGEPTWILITREEYEENT
jgi:hypothetical protein